MGGRYHTLHSLSFMVIVIFVFLHLLLLLMDGKSTHLDFFVIALHHPQEDRRILFVITTVVKLVHVTFTDNEVHWR